MLRFCTPLLKYDVPGITTEKNKPLLSLLVAGGFFNGEISLNSVNFIWVVVVLNCYIGYCRDEHSNRYGAENLLKMIEHLKMQ